MKNRLQKIWINSFFAVLSLVIGLQSSYAKGPRDQDIYSVPFPVCSIFDSYSTRERNPLPPLDNVLSREEYLTLLTQDYPSHIEVDRYSSLIVQPEFVSILSSPVMFEHGHYANYNQLVKQAIGQLHQELPNFYFHFDDISTGAFSVEPLRKGSKSYVYIDEDIQTLRGLLKALQRSYPDCRLIFQVSPSSRYPLFPVYQIASTNSRKLPDGSIFLEPVYALDEQGEKVLSLPEGLPRNYAEVYDYIVTISLEAVEIREDFNVTAIKLSTDWLPDQMNATERLEYLLNTDNLEDVLVLPQLVRALGVNSFDYAEHPILSSVMDSNPHRLWSSVYVGTMPFGKPKTDLMDFPAKAMGDQFSHLFFIRALAMRGDQRLLHETSELLLNSKELSPQMMDHLGHSINIYTMND